MTIKEVKTKHPEIYRLFNKYVKDPKVNQYGTEWKLSDDLKHFKKETKNCPLIMGSNTFKSLPGILPNREHIVLSTSMFSTESMSVFTSIKEALEYIKESEYKCVYVIGGANVVKQFMNYSLFDELIITQVDCQLTGDTVLDLDHLKLENWSLYKSETFDKSEINEYSFKINRYLQTKKRFY